MMVQRSRRGGDMVLGAGLVLIGVVAGGLLFSGRGTEAQAAASDIPGSSYWIPAVPFSGSDSILAKEAQGQYIIISSSGWARPVRARDNDLRSTPGETFVFAP